MALIRVTHLSDDAFQIDVRGHHLIVDQPSRNQDEAGPTPVELFVASLVACAGFYAERFMRRHGLAYEGLQIHGEWAMRAGQPARVSRVAMRVMPPAPIPAELREQLLAAIDMCTVTNSLREPPAIAVDIATLPVTGGVA
ncbi:OsmC family protein [Catelliglobosispora koreensis]|uniref:OsmC family protein n=1 Tax=Catelliglobosispora koreensis TaxID=129052 RepID=UPI0004756DF8|nr:OsmC family protein [Catelliglobosispora koreensis]